jgi:hypothetical protein
MIRKMFILAFLFLGFLGSARAEEGGTEAQYLWVQEASVSTSFRAQLGLGLLDAKGITGARGTPITNYFGLDYALTPDMGLGLGLPLAGTLSSGPDNYGIGNVVLGAKYVRPLDRFRFGVGMNLALPTAQSRAAIGIFTRDYVRFVQDQVALSPYVSVHYVRDRLTFSLDLGTDLQLFTKSAAGRDRVEDAIFYDAAVALSVYENFWGTVEMGGYSTLSYNSNQTELYAGPGFRYQDREISLGVHFLAPFRKPARDQIDFLAVGDFRVYF